MSRINTLRSKFFWRLYTTFSLLFLCTTAAVSLIIVYQVQDTIRSNATMQLQSQLELLKPVARLIINPKTRVLSEPVWQALYEAWNDQQNPYWSSLDRSKSDRFNSASKVRNIPTSLISIHTASGQEISQIGWPLPFRTESNAGLQSELSQAQKQPYGQSVRSLKESIDNNSKSRHSFIGSVAQDDVLFVATALRSDSGDIAGFLRAGLPIRYIEAEVARLRLLTAIIALIGIFLALGIGWLLARRVALPVQDMVRVAEAMRRGDYSQRVRANSTDELGRLSATLNRLGSELTKKIGELKHLEAVRRDFVANVSHEIKTPLTSIKGYVETLRSKPDIDPNTMSRFLEKIDRNATRLTTLVHGILNLAKIESQHEVFVAEPTHWTPIVVTVLAQYEDALANQGLQIEVIDGGDLPHVYGHKEAMTQILDNLVSNAIRYTPSGGLVTVALSATSAGKVQLTVADTGVGIPEGAIDRIFERFYRVDKARSADLGGTGLGLAIVKHLTNRMQGSIRVTSELGGGSSFTVRLQAVS